eukprot:13530951-Alexandrium_andersonii.AAC.1
MRAHGFYPGAASERMRPTASLRRATSSAMGLRAFCCLLRRSESRVVPLVPTRPSLGSLSAL